MLKYKLNYILKDNKFFLLALGAFPGAMLRWQIDNDLLVNFVGTFILGFLFGLPNYSKLKLIIGVGFCGALTTFSGWIVKCIYLIETGNFFDAVILIIKTLVFGLLSASIAFWLSKRIKYLRPS